MTGPSLIPYNLRHLIEPFPDPPPDGPNGYPDFLRHPFLRHLAAEIHDHHRLVLGRQLPQSVEDLQAGDEPVSQLDPLVLVVHLDVVVCEGHPEKEGYL